MLYWTAGLTVDNGYGVGVIARRERFVGCHGARAGHRDDICRLPCGQGWCVTGVCGCLLTEDICMCSADEWDSRKGWHGKQIVSRGLNEFFSVEDNEDIAGLPEADRGVGRFELSLGVFFEIDANCDMGLLIGMMIEGRGVYPRKMIAGDREDMV